jgi:hypothetical protein
VSEQLADAEARIRDLTAALQSLIDWAGSRPVQAAVWLSRVKDDTLIEWAEVWAKARAALPAKETSDGREVKP